MHGTRIRDVKVVKDISSNASMPHTESSNIASASSSIPSSTSSSSREPYLPAVESEDDIMDMLEFMREAGYEIDDGGGAELYGDSVVSMDTTSYEPVQNTAPTTFDTQFTFTQSTSIQSTVPSVVERKEVSLFTTNPEEMIIRMTRDLKLVVDPHTLQEKIKLMYAGTFSVYINNTNNKIYKFEFIYKAKGDNT
jgi:hypothetical protein